MGTVGEVRCQRIAWFVSEGILKGGRDGCLWTYQKWIYQKITP
jgi:hypothetical protein